MFKRVGITKFIINIIKKYKVGGQSTQSDQIIEEMMKNDENSDKYKSHFIVNLKDIIEKYRINDESD